MPQKYQYKGEKDTEQILATNSNCTEEKNDSLEKWFISLMKDITKSMVPLRTDELLLKSKEVSPKRIFCVKL